ncbi:sensor domain-containing protein [Brevibacillus ginsengisoli]|uniref:sensor domain-containing protein n=1 Tax=Brevibacillus ginsengisoli TaxID=363854 RepID=UPI003CFB3CB4
MNKKPQNFYGISARDLFTFCEGISDIVFLMTVEEGSRFRYCLVNQAGLDFSGLTENAYGKLIEDVYETEMAEFLTNKYRQAVLAKEPIFYEDYVELPDGSLSGESVLTPIFNEQGVCTHVISITRDITEQKRYEERLTFLAYHDDLTGLPNRRRFQEEMTQSIEDAKRLGKPLAILFLDLDRFKIVNDTLGHNKGDQLLQMVGNRLNELLSDHLVARLGGDEFVVLVKDFQSLEDLSNMAQQILQVIESPVNINSYEFFVTSSIGIAVLEDDSTNADSLMKNADQAMYAAKANGKNNYYFYESKQELKLFPRLKLEHLLRKAIKQDEFELHYQPVYHTLTGEITCMEVLIRWAQPTLGMIMPGDFIPIAEETGLIVPIGEWVLKTACTQNKRWQEQGLSHIPIAVNLSPFHFQQQNVVQRIAGILQETGLDSKYLTLEITESMAMQQVDAAINKLQDLKEMGIKVSIDDFGTGYSSLSYLKKFPIDSLKIDRSFIKDIVANHEDATIVKAIIVMARSLKRQIIAEGVETEEQMNLLRELGCTKMQGYLFSKPISAEAMGVYLADYS